MDRIAHASVVSHQRHRISHEWLDTSFNLKPKLWGTSAAGGVGEGSLGDVDPSEVEVRCFAEAEVAAFAAAVIYRLARHLAKRASAADGDEPISVDKEDKHRATLAAVIYEN